MKTCYFVGAGDFFPERFCPGADDYLIAVDAGYCCLAERGVMPDLVIGDFDSLGSVPEHPNVVVCPKMKDDTDMLIAVRRAIDMGFERLMLFGGTGGRLDHTLANIQTLVYAAKRGADAFLFGEDFVITALTAGTLRFSGYSGGFSVFCLGEKAEGVFESGVKYPLFDAVLTCDFPLGVSNEFCGAQAEISVGEGVLVVFWRGDGNRPLPERAKNDGLNKKNEENWRK